MTSFLGRAASSAVTLVGMGAVVFDRTLYTESLEVATDEALSVIQIDPAPLAYIGKTAAENA